MTSVLHLEFCVKSGFCTSETAEAEQDAVGGDGWSRVDSRAQTQTHHLRSAKPKIVVDNFSGEGEGVKRD